MNNILKRYLFDRENSNKINIRRDRNILVRIIYQYRYKVAF